MALDDFEALDEGPMARSRRCRTEDCEGQAVVQNPYTGAFEPLCFRCGFIAALAEDPEAQTFALGWAVAKGIETSRGVTI